MTPNDRSAAERLLTHVPLWTTLAHHEGDKRAPKYALDPAGVRKALAAARREGLTWQEALLHESARQYVEDDIANAIAGEYRRRLDALASDASVPEPPTETGGEADAAKELLGDLEYCWCAGDERPAQATEETV